ncbi:TetR/AcrR family transcriptional regulator [Nocardia yunnanensis]|uniref:TetR/AcrR family transcriptional regulator n=1 Tax=Nocardia yunnanensis TaxID=2382165 RepID=A0A386Z8W7_9NOCA|nr:TetR/AcrR family transcriptional regulator [Nocardia yunnanensis]AYF74252.1 TetR/AcrR family transcriptional regulator [Nocardia yunnanensis]
MVKRGPYGKGIERRERILEAALHTIAERGFLATSVAELAEAVGLSQSGLLHYFGSKEELFVAVLRKRDELTVAAVPEPTPELLVQIIRRNTQVPGLIELFTHMQAAAADPRHPAHEYMRTHYELGTAGFAELIRGMQRAGTVPANVDPEVMATAFMALSDGLQSRWLIDPSLDMAFHLHQFWTQYTGMPFPSA